MENLLVAAIGGFPESTLTMLKFRLDAACAARNLPTVSVSTIGRRLDKKLITASCELSFNALKARVKQGLAGRRDDLIATDNLPRGHKVSRRNEILFEEVLSAFGYVTPDHAWAWYLHTLSFYNKCATNLICAEIRTPKTPKWKSHVECAKSHVEQGW